MSQNNPAPDHTANDKVKSVIWKQKFGDPVTNLDASEENPTQHEFFIRVVRRTGRMNAGVPRHPHIGARDMSKQEPPMSDLHHPSIKTGILIVCPVCGGVGKIAPEMLSIGARFRMERSRLNMTQAEMSVKLQIGRAQLANVEGDRSKPGLEMLMRAADAMGVSIDYLLGRSTRCGAIGNSQKTDVEIPNV